METEREGHFTVIITFTTKGEKDTTRALRWLLKVALRRFGLRAVSIEPVDPDQEAP